MSDYRTIQVADALVSGLWRFPDPLASVFVLMDFLTLSLGEKTKVRLEKDGWILSNDPDDDKNEILSGDTVQFGDVKLSVGGDFEFLANLPEILELHTTGSVPEISGRFSEARRKWTVPDNDFEWPLAIEGIPEQHPLKGFAEAVQELVDESTEKTGFGVDAQILDVIALTSPDDGKHKFCRLTDNNNGGSSEGDLIPGTLTRSSKTGFVQWSARIPQDGSHLLVVPCMVANVPWAHVVCRCSEPYWRNGISLYRDKLPRVLEGLRTLAQSAFLTRVHELLEEQILESGWKPSELNRKWMSLGKYFPFAVPQLVKADSLDHRDVNEHIRLAGEDWVVVPAQNQNFTPLLVEDSKSWGDIRQMAPMMKRATKARLAAEEKATEELAQNIAHEYKNLTADVKVLADRVAKEVATDPSVAEKTRLSIARVARHVSQLNKLSMALYELTRDDLTGIFKPSDDALAIFRSALRLMLELRSQVETESQEFIIDDDMSFDEAVENLAAVYLSTSSSMFRKRKAKLKQFEELLDRTNVQILLLAVAEPVRNVRVPQKETTLPKSITVWTDVDPESGECLLYQKTTEPFDTDRTFPSKGAERTNKILPNTFCTIDTSVTTVNVEELVAQPEEDPAIAITRVTRIKVNGRPF